MGALWDIVQAHIDAQPYGASLRGIAAKLNMSPTALGNWRTLRAMPLPVHLRALANLTGTAYSRVLDAALEDAGYLERPSGPHGNNPPSTRAGGRPAQATVELDRQPPPLDRAGSQRPRRARGPQGPA